MSDFKFNCPHCQQSLEAPEEMLGQKIDCPSCNEPITLPDPPRTQTLPTPPPQRQTRSCPFCGEDILAAAIKCKHCGEFLDGRPSDTVLHRGNSSQQNAAPRPPVQTIEQTGKGWKGMQLICGLAAIVGAFMLGFDASLGFVFIVLGLGGFTIARIGAWWEHG